MPPPSCSVVIDSYNYGRYVVETVNSVLAQTLLPDEIIVVDDGSTDNSLEILREKFGANPRVTIIAQRNTGQGMAITAGLVRAQGDLIFFLDSDDAYAPDHIEKVSRVYAENKQVDYVITAYRQVGAKSDVIFEYPATQHLGFSVIGTMMGLLYVGGMTSLTWARPWPGPANIFSLSQPCSTESTIRTI